MEKHFWTGILLLLFLLALTICISWSMTAIHTPVRQMLTEAQQEALENHWQHAQQLAENARMRWEHFRSVSAAFADHDPIEEADSLFAQLALYTQTDNQADFALCCAQLRQLMQAITQANTPSWWNLL